MVIIIGSKRLHSLDVIRGSMIFYVIFLHAIIQRVFASQGSEFEKVVNDIPLFLAILAFPIILFSIWGPIFTFVSGAATGYNLGNNVFENPESINESLKKRVANSLMLLVISKISMFFFSGRTSDHSHVTHSLFSGSLETGNLSIPEFLHLFTCNTLESMALSGLLLSLLLYIMWKGQKAKPKQTAKTLLLLAIGVFFITNYLRGIVSDSEVLMIKESLWSDNSYIKYYLFLTIYGSRFAMFPVFAFALVGAAFGVLISGKVSFKEFFKWVLISGTGFIGVFVISFINGFDMIGTFANELVLLQMQCLNIGLMIYLLGICYYFFDVKVSKNKKKPNNSKKKGTFLKFIRKYSDLSLTIYILEPLIAQSLYLLFAYLNKGPFATNFPLIMLYITTVVFTWLLIIWIWKKSNNKFSFEWLMGKGRKIILDFLNGYWWKKYTLSKSTSHHPLQLQTLRARGF
ncbi:MAG: hypothetical protein ACTSVL_10280 [Promethearchaeota archaeon]